MPTEGPAVLIFIRALILARKAGSSEISVDDLLCAMNEIAGFEETAIQPGPPFLPAPEQELPFSSGAMAAIQPLGEISGISRNALRGALLEAKHRGAS
jgi:hypothetical protein